MNGYLIFYPNTLFKGTHTDESHIIEVNAFSELGGENRAHFNFFVNKTLVADFFAVSQKKKYGIRWKGNLEDIDSIMIQFDNDRVYKWGDRNLYVKEIIIDHKIIIPYLYNSVYDIGPLDGKNRIINNYNSNAEFTRNELIRMGVDSSRIVAVQGEAAYINRTLKSALAFRNWLKASKKTVKGINIISSGLKARRKYMIYTKILGKDYNVGRIPLPDFNNPGLFKKITNELWEFFGLFYYWVILRFY
jgi:Ca-dependent carbohydrate-binding module xylan-binding